MNATTTTDDANLTKEDLINNVSSSVQEWFDDPSNSAFFALVTEGILLTAVATCGLVGNAMSVAVLVKINSTNGKIRSFTNLLRALASFDALFLATAILGRNSQTLISGVGAFVLPLLWSSTGIAPNEAFF